MNYHIATGLDGKPSIWPVKALSKDKNGVFRDIKGRVVAGVAMDAASTNADEDFSPEVKAKIARAKRKVALDAEEDALAELLIGLLMPSLKAMVMDDMEAEQAAQGSFSSEDESELERGECSGNDEDNTFGASYAASLKATNEYWAEAKRKAAASRRQSQAVQRTGRYAPADNRKQAQAADALTQTNAKAAKPYNLFQSAASIIKRQRKLA